MDPTYIGAYGKIKAHSTDFLTEDTLRRIYEAKSVEEMISTLYSTFYREDLDLFSTVSKDRDLLNNAINHRLVLRNRIALMGAPAPGREIIRAYLSKWDIENIKTIISSKFMGYDLRETENYLLSFRDIPLGIFGGRMGQSDFRSILSQNSVESVVSYLSNYGYGQVLLQYMERYRRVNDVSILLSALDSYYFSNLLSSVKFYNGDEGPVFKFFQETIDVRNLMVALKGKSMDIEYSRISDSMIPGGSVPLSRIEEIYSSSSVQEALQKFPMEERSRERLTAAGSSGGLQIIESALLGGLYSKYLERFSALAISIAYTFSFILKSERERENLRSAAFGNIYNIPREKIMSLIY
jgi:V/A-type H+-transporting ATPase subunit C